MHALNPTKAVIAKLHELLDQAAVAVKGDPIELGRFAALLQDPDIQAWKNSPVKLGGKGRPRRRAPHEWRSGWCSGCKKDVARAREAPDKTLRCEQCEGKDKTSGNVSRRAESTAGDNISRS